MTVAAIELSMPVVGGSWPLLAALLLAGLARELHLARRRILINRALHELRRPLQALALAPGAGGGQGDTHPAAAAPARGPSSLELALAALSRLDRVVNDTRPGRADPVARRAGRARRRAGPSASPPPVAAWVDLLRAARDRWAEPARALGGSVRFAEDRDGDRGVRLAEAIDNLIFNGLTHGGGDVVLSLEPRPGQVRIEISDGGVRRAMSSPGPHRPDRPRHGHGLAIVRQTVRDHGGRLDLRFGPHGGRATVALPAKSGAERAPAVAAAGNADRRASRPG